MMKTLKSAAILTAAAAAVSVSGMTTLKPRESRSVTNHRAAHMERAEAKRARKNAKRLRDVVRSIGHDPRLQWGVDAEDTVHTVRHNGPSEKVSS